jgi:hypothetical protein
MNSENLNKLTKWVLPIIEKNDGWGTGTLTREDFFANPIKYQHDIEGTVQGVVYVLEDDGMPCALLEYEVGKVFDENLFANDKRKEFEFLVGKTFDKGLVSEVKKFLESRTIFTGIGLVTRVDLQGQKKGYVEELYKITNKGINFGWTSNPIVVRMRRKMFENTLYFPPMGEYPNTLAEWAICWYVYADRVSDTEGKYEGFDLGVSQSSYFVEKRGEEYKQIARSMLAEGKISQLDSKRISLVLERPSCAAAIVSWN